MCAQSSQASTETSSSFISRALEKIPHVTETNQVLKSLKIYQLSSFFNSYRHILFTCLHQGKFTFGEQEFCLSENFTRYFQSGHFNAYYPIECQDPIAVGRVKKLFNVLLTAEKFLLKLEKYDSVNLDSVVSFILELKPEAHELATKVLELTSDCFNLFEPSANTLLILSSNLFSSIQMLSTGQFQGSKNLTDIYQSINHYIHAIDESAKHIDFGQLVAGSIGYGINLMGPDESNSESIGVLLTKLPAFFNQLSEKIERFSQEIAYKHSRDSSVVIQDFQQQTKLVLNQLANLSLNGVSFSYDLFSLLNNCFRIWDFKNTLQSRLGLLQESSQRFIIEHLRALKYQFLLPIFNVADDLELDLKLQPGEIREKMAPHLEKFYWWLVYLTRDNIEFKGQDKELLFLFDDHWNQERLNRTYQVYAETKLKLFQLKELFDTYQRVQSASLSIVSDECWKQELPLFLPYIKKADDEWYVKILENPDNFKMPAQQISCANYISQEVASLELQLLDIESMLECIQYKEERLVHFMEWPADWQINLQLIERRFCEDYLLISQAGKYYFYDRPKKEIAPLSPSQLKQVSETHQLAKLPNLLFRCNAQQQKNLEYAIDRKIFKTHKNSHLEFVEPALESVLHSLADSEKYLKNIFLQKYRLDKAESMARDFFNFITISATEYPEQLLTPAWRDNLIRQGHHFSFILLSTQVPLLSLLQTRQQINMRELQKQVEEQQVQVFSLICRQKAQLLRQEKLIGDEYLKSSFEHAKENFDSGPLENRVGYFLNSTRGSDICKLLKNNLQSWFEMYHSEAKNYMCKTSDGYYSALLNDHKAILTFPKQVVDGMIIYNTLSMFENFFIKLEKLKKSDFADDFVTLFTKIYLVVDYVSLQNYVMTQFRYTYHMQLFKKFYAQVLNIYDINKLPLEGYQLVESDKMQIDSSLSMLEKWIYWFLNSPELARLKIGEQALFNKSDNLKIIVSIRDIIGNARSYFWLIFKLGFYDIYSLVEQLKNRLANFNSVVYKLTASNLYHLKSSMFAEFMTAIDDLEVNLGVRAEFFSDKVSQIIDVLFEHFINALNLDLVKFSQLMMSEDTQLFRIKHFDDKLQKIANKQSQLEETSQRLLFFLKQWEQVEQQRLVYGDEIANTLKPFFIDIIAILIEFQSNRMNPTRPELMSKSEIFWDRKIDDWLNHSEYRDKIHSKDYINLVSSISQFMIGLVNTEKLKTRLLLSKKQHLLDRPRPVLEEELKKFTNRQFDNYFRHLKSNRQHVCLKMNHLYIKELEEFFATHRQGLVDEISKALSDEYAIQQTIQLAVPLHKSTLSQKYLEGFAKLIVDFNKKYNHHYFYLENVLEIIENYERYLGRVKTGLMQGKGDWFENDKTIENKLQQLKSVFNLVLNFEGSVEQRVAAVQKVLKESKEFKTSILNYAEISGSGLLGYLLKLWQWLMLILIKFGFYEPEHHKVFNLLSDIKPSAVPIDFDEGRFKLFNGLNVEHQASSELVKGVNTCVA